RLGLDRAPRMALADLALPSHPDGAPHLLQPLVVLAARFPSGRLLLHGQRARCRPDERLNAGGGDLQPGQPVDLVGRDLLVDRDRGRGAGPDPRLPFAPYAGVDRDGVARWGRTV